MHHMAGALPSCYKINFILAVWREYPPSVEKEMRFLPDGRYDIAWFQKSQYILRMAYMHQTCRNELEVFRLCF